MWIKISSISSNRLQAVLYEFYILFTSLKMKAPYYKAHLIPKEKKNCYIFKIPKGQKSHLNTGLT